MMASSKASLDSQHPLLYHVLSLSPIVSTLAGYLRTQDLIHLALANRTTYAVIFASHSYFETLKRACGCNELGVLARRTTWAGEVEPLHFDMRYRVEGGIYCLINGADPEIIRRVEAVKSSVCQSFCGRPWEKCSAYGCEGCSFFPRIFVLLFTLIMRTGQRSL